MRPLQVFFCEASQKPSDPPDYIKSGTFLPEMLGMAFVTAALRKVPVSSPLQLTEVPLDLPCHAISLPTPAKLLRAPVLPPQSLLEMLKGPDPAGIPKGGNGQRNPVFWNGEIVPLKEPVFPALTGVWRSSRADTEVQSRIAFDFISSLLLWREMKVLSSDSPNKKGIFSLYHRRTICRDLPSSSCQQNAFQ